MPFNPINGGGRSGSPAGGSSAPSPARNTGGMDVKSLAPARYGSGIRVNDSFKIGPATQINQIFQCPAYRVPIGARFTLLAPNVNTGIALASEVREQLSSQTADIVPELTPIDFPVDNTGRVWVLLGAVGDYVIARITSDAS